MKFPADCFMGDTTVKINAGNDGINKSAYWLAVDINRSLLIPPDVSVSFVSTTSVWIMHSTLGMSHRPRQAFHLSPGYLLMCLFTWYQSMNFPRTGRTLAFWEVFICLSSLRVTCGGEFSIVQLGALFIACLHRWMEWHFVFRFFVKH